MLCWRCFQGSSGPALASSYGQNYLELHPYLSLLNFFIESKQKYDPAAFCSSEMAFWSKSQPLKQPSRQRLARGWNSQSGMPHSSLSLPAPTQLQRVNNSIKLEPQQCAWICIFRALSASSKSPELAPQPGWSLCRSTHSGKQQFSPGRICCEG